jgi:hypothetical protein
MTCISAFTLSLSLCMYMYMYVYMYVYSPSSRTAIPSPPVPPRYSRLPRLLSDFPNPRLSFPASPCPPVQPANLPTSLGPSPPSSPTIRPQSPPLFRRQTHFSPFLPVSRVFLLFPPAAASAASSTSPHLPFPPLTTSEPVTPPSAALTAPRRSYNQIGDAGAAALAGGLRRLAALEKLELG